MNLRARMDQHPTLHPPGEQQPRDHKHGRDHPGTDCSPVHQVPKARQEEAGSSAPRKAPQHLFISLFVLMQGRCSRRGWGQRRAGPRLQGQGSVGSGCVHRVLYSPQSTTGQGRWGLGQHPHMYSIE